MYPQDENPVDPQRVTPPGTGDEQLFSQLYHGGQSEPTDAEAEAEHRRRTAAIAGANTALGVSAATGSAAAGAVIATGQGAGVGGAGVGGAAGGSGGAVASGVVKGGLATKFLVGGIAGAVVVSGVVVGVTVLNRDKVGNEAAPIENVAADNGIEKYDFDNVAFTDESGAEFQLKDGHYQPPDVPSDTEGYFLTGTEFADADGDGDTDAATLLEWRPNAGHTTTYVYLWEWNGDKPEQIGYPVTNGYYSTVGKLKAVKGGFSVESIAAPPDIASTDDPVTETITIGIKDGFPVQTKPVFGSVDRCVEFPDFPDTGPYPDVVPLAAPIEGSPPVAEAKDIKRVMSVWNDRSQAFQGKWFLTRVEHTDGSTNCGWIPADTPPGD